MDGMNGMNLILVDLQKKYRRMDMILTFTKELEQIIASGDETSLRLVLEMRQKEMDVIDQLDREIQNRLSMMSPVLKAKMRKILKPTSGNSIKLENPLETNIFDTNKRILKLVGRIVNLDTTIHDKIVRV